METSPEKELCPNCRNSGWIISVEGAVEKVTPCPDCRAASRAKRLLEKAGIPPRFSNATFKTYQVPEGNVTQFRALERAIEYVEAFPSGRRGLLFIGPPGVGKTHLSVAILRSLITRKNVEGVFVDEAELLRRLQYSYTPDSPETEREVMLPLMKVELLVWDDLGTGRPTEWVSETIRTVLNYRYTHTRHTIFSSNCPDRPTGSRSAGYTLKERITAPLYSRLSEMCEWVEIAGEDWRDRIRKEGQDSQKKKAPR